MCGHLTYIPKDERSEIISQVEKNLTVESHPGPYAKDVYPGAEVPVWLSISIFSVSDEGAKAGASLGTFKYRLQTP